jgi:sec-independent protein translocase protein TatA
MRIGATEIILIIVLVLLLFGGSKLSGIGKALGQSIKDFKHSLKDDDAAAAGDSAALPAVKPDESVKDAPQHG